MLDTRHWPQVRADHWEENHGWKKALQMVPEIQTRQAWTAYFTLCHIRKHGINPERHKFWRAKCHCSLQVSSLPGLQYLRAPNGSPLPMGIQLHWLSEPQVLHPAFDLLCDRLDLYHSDDVWVCLVVNTHWHALSFAMCFIKSLIFKETSDFNDYDLFSIAGLRCCKPFSCVVHYQHDDRRLTYSQHTSLETKHSILFTYLFIYWFFFVSRRNGGAQARHAQLQGCEPSPDAVLALRRVLRLLPLHGGDRWDVAVAAGLSSRGSVCQWLIWSCSNEISKVYIVAFFWIVKLPEGRLHPNITLRSKKERPMHTRSCSLSRLLSLDPCFLEWQREDDFAFWVLELPSAGELPVLGLPWMAHGASAQTAWCGAANPNRQQKYLA